MAEARTVWQDFLAAQHHAITKAFRELQERWRGIFDQEGARWFQAGKKWEFAREPGSSFSSWQASPKPLEEAVKEYQHALGAMREATETRLPWQAYGGHGSYMSGPPPDKQTHDWMPERGTVAYVEWVVRDAIRTGYEEGYPLRADQIENIRRHVWEQEIGQRTGQRNQGLLEEYARPPVVDWRHTAMDDLPELEHDTHEPDYPTQYAGLMGSAPDPVDIDTSDPDRGPAWQQTIQQLQARLDALEQDVPAQEQAHDQDHDAGMGY
jgi:hypothetical protein